MELLDLENVAIFFLFIPTSIGWVFRGIFKVDRNEGESQLQFYIFQGARLWVWVCLNTYIIYIYDELEHIETYGSWLVELNKYQHPMDFFRVPVPYFETSKFMGDIPSLKLPANASENRPFAPKGKDRLQTPIFQGRTVSFTRLQICPLDIFGNYPPQMVPMDLNIGFQGLALIQGQICNPVISGSVSWGVVFAPEPGCNRTDGPGKWNFREHIEIPGFYLKICFTSSSWHPEIRLVNTPRNIRNFIRFFFHQKIGENLAFCKSICGL